MLGKLIKKEFTLTMHPTVPVMLLLGTMMLIPNYPYLVAFFYVTLSLFFTCLNARENNDAVFSLSLPVKKSDLVRSRILFACVIELASILIAAPFTVLSAKIAPQGNAAGMDANLVLLGQGLLLFGLFNLVFFTSYYKDISKVGVPFVIASVVSFVLIGADICLCYTVPYVKNVLDTPGFEHILPKTVCLFAGALSFTILTFTAYRIGTKRFLKLDIK